ncbi:acyltransferase [Fodinibacter luteus]|uniref:Acyltransferase n=1 Tax=Fodinibacter luteus TaxID=552064 RepID=A0ABP8JX22_9MICO
MTVTVDRRALEAWASSRRPYLDNLKVVLIGAIIAIHALLGYASMVEAWTYTQLREVTLATATQVGLFVVAAPFGLFLMALLFLVAGLLTPPSLARKGTSRFVTDRLLRLGIPFVVYVLLVQPVLVYALEHPLGHSTGSFREEYLGTEGRLDTGPLWFVGVLLLYSLGYAGWRAVRSWWTARSPRTAVRQPPGGRRPQITAGTLALVAAVVAPASFVVRLIWPYGSEAGFSDLNFWEWPACLAVFLLGTVAADRGWAAAVPTALVRRSRTVTLLGVVAMAVLMAVVGLRDSVEEALGGASWAAGAFAAIDAVLTVFGSVWLLGVAQHRLDRRWRHGPWLSRSAYGAFMLQTPFLLGFAVALRPVGVPAEVKALLVAAAAVACSFAAAWFLIRRVPGMARVL